MMKWKTESLRDGEIFIFSVRSADINTSISDNSIIDLNSFNGTLLPCLFSQEIRNSACNFRDTESGHYYGSYIPIKTGPVLLSIFYNSPIQGNFHLFIFLFLLFCFISFLFLFLFLILFLNHIVMIMKDVESEKQWINNSPNFVFDIDHISFSR